MASHPPPNDSKRDRARETVRSGMRWVKQALQPPSSPRIVSRRSPSPAPPRDPSQIVTSRPISRPVLDVTGHVAQPSTEGNATILAGTYVSSPKSGACDQLKETRQAAWSRLEMALQALEKGSRAFPPLKSAVSELLACLDIIKVAASNRRECQDLAADLTITVNTLEEYMDELKLEDRNGILARIASSIKEEVARINKHQRRGKLGRLLESIQSEEDVIRCYRLIEASFRQLQNNVNIRTLRNTTKQFEVTLLQNLSPEEDARYDSAYSTTVKRRGCTAETRERIQEDLRNWAQDPNAAKVYWMNGMAGTGKTTIAYSLCEWLEENKLLGASFFCSRAAGSCRNVNRIVPTLACQLARYSPAFRSALCTVLENDTGAAKLNVVQQFEKLVKGPSLEVKAAIPDGVVIVIDALDECEDNHGVRLVIATLMRFAAALPVKFFVASRPEQVIREKMLSSSDYSPFVLRLHDIEESIVGEDIKKYLKEALSLMSPPPSNDQIEQLTKRAGKLFIYAATVVRYIYPGDIPVDSGDRLRMMLSIDTTSPIEDEDSIGYEELDQLYATVLAAAFNPRLKRREKENRQLVLGTVVCAREPMNMQTLALLLGLTEQQVSLALQPLQSVLHISTGGGLVSPLHASFPDYLFDQPRSGTFSWHCSVSRYSEILAHRSFDMMREKLQFNICHLESSYVFDEDVPDLGERIKANISPVLFYACRYWGEHLRQAGVLELLCDKLVDFFTHRLLFWMEVLNLKQCITKGAEILLHTQNWLSQVVNGPPINIHKYAIDAWNFVIRFAASGCTRSTPHIYVSALPFCSKSSSVYAHYWARTKGLIEDKGTAMLGEHALLATWKTGSAIRAVAFSPDGTRVVSGSDDKMIWVWDTHAGDVVTGPFEGHSDSVNSVAFSPDGTRFVSGSDDRTVRIWDTYTGGIVAGPFTGHSGPVKSVTFSPDGTRIASGSHDSTIRVWDMHTGNVVIGPFKGHSDSVNSVAFSPDGTHIASGSSDQTVRVWDMHTGAVVAGPFKGHSDSVNSVAFSPDGIHIASGSSDQTVRVWDIHTGNIVAGPFEGHLEMVSSVAFSSDGSYITSGSGDKYRVVSQPYDHTIRVWDIHTGNIVAGPFKGHSRGVNSVAFSPDSIRIVSGSYDRTIRVWGVHASNITAEPFEGQGHSDWITSVACSPDGTCIVSASEDKAIRLWDMVTGGIVAGPFAGHSGFIRSIACSAGGTHIVSGSDDRTIRVWDMHTGDVVAGPFKGHSGSVNSVAFSPDGTCIVSGSHDCTIRVWDMHNGDVVAGPLTGHSGSINSVAFSPDGTRIVSGSSDKTIRVWDVHAGDTIAGPLEGHSDSVNSVAFSSDGTRFVSGSEDWTIRVWDTYTGGIIAGPFTGHSGPVKSVAFSPDGAHGVSGSSDSTIWVWDVRTGDTIAGPLEGHSGWISSVVFSPDGTRIVSGSHDNTIRVWDMRTGDVVVGPFEGQNWDFNNDGWITSNSTLLLWVSPELHKYFPRPPHTLVIGGQGSISLEHWDLFLGDDWSRCYTYSK